MIDPKNYVGREQSYVKHRMLDDYLERFALIVGTWADGITYVDGFSGPWNTQSSNFSDSSFGIALDQLGRAKAHIRKNSGRDLKIRCCFVEENSKAFAKLKSFTSSITDAEISLFNSSFEYAIPEIISFFQKGGKKNFLFLLIDPTGWTGFSMKAIKPLLAIQPGEVLVNFMTNHIKRFIDLDDKTSREQFEQLFGDAGFRSVIAGLQYEEREYAAVETYAKNLANSGNFDHVCKAIILDPNKNATHFHLIYATRHVKGIEVFKGAEKAAMAEMEKVRAIARQRNRQTRTSQLELLEAPDMHDCSHYADLRDQFISKAKAFVLRELDLGAQVPYDRLWELSMRFPIVWESDLKAWLSEWAKKGLISINLGPGKRVPKRGNGHFVKKNIEVK